MTVMNQKDFDKNLNGPYHNYLSRTYAITLARIAVIAEILATRILQRPRSTRMQSEPRKRISLVVCGNNRIKEKE